MRTRRIQITILGLFCLALATARPSAQKPGKPAPSPDIPGSAIIACFGSDAVCHDGFHPDFGANDPLWDTLYGDDRLSSSVNGVVAALLAGSGQLRLGIVNDVMPQRRSYVIALPGTRHADQSRECGIGQDPCVLDGYVSDDENNPGLGFTVAVRVSPAGNAGSLTNVGLSNGLLGLQVAQTVRSTFIFGFQVAESDPAPAARWALHWNNVIYPGSGMVNVTRTGQCTWKVWSDGSADELAGLLLHDFGTTSKGKNRDDGNYEGRFSIPFEIEYTANPGSMPGGCQP